MACVAHHSVPKGFADVKEKFVARACGILEVLLIPHQFRDGIDHVGAIVEDRDPVSIQERVTKPPAVDTAIIRSLGSRQVISDEHITHLVSDTVVLIDLSETVGREIDGPDIVELVPGVVGNTDFLRDELLVHLPHDELAVAQ